jgi:uncharacterized protein
MLTRTLIGVAMVALLSAATIDTRLADAAMRGDKDAVRSLLKQKVDVNAAHGDGATALHWATYNDDVELVKLLLAAGANVKAATREGAITPLFMACQNGNAAVIDVLLKAGADAQSVKANGTTALMMAAASGHADAVKILLERGADVNAKESVYGQTALMFSAALNRDAVVKVLMSHGADANVATTIRKLERVRFDQDGNIVEERPARADAGEASNANRAKQEQSQADANAAASQAERLMLDSLAQAIGFKSAVYLVAKPRARAGDVAARPPRKVGADFMGGMSALLYAAREGHMAAARALVEAGADINQASGDKITPIVMAIMNGHYDLGKYLLDQGADPNLASITGLTPLYATIDMRWAPKTWFPQPSTEQEKIHYLDLMRALIAHGANVNAQVVEKPWFRSFTNDYTWVDPAGATAFWRAAQSDDIAAMKLLVEHGADPKIPTKSGDTPLMAAAGIGWAANWSVNASYPAIEAVKYCIELGDDVNAADNRGYTALHGAAYLGNNEMVNYLVSRGAKADAKSKQGDTVADMANGPTRFGQPHLDTVALLEKLGSANSHNCRSDQCVIAAKSQVYELSPLDLVQKENLDHLAISLGFKGVEYHADVPSGRGAGRGEQAREAPPAPETAAASPTKPAPKPAGGRSN